MEESFRNRICRYLITVGGSLFRRRYVLFFGGDFFVSFRFFSFWYFIQHCFICRPSDSTVSEDAGIDPRTVATSALTDFDAQTTRLDFIVTVTILLHH
jgi:hypothetical protein